MFVDKFCGTAVKPPDVKFLLDILKDASYPLVVRVQASWGHAQLVFKNGDRQDGRRRFRDALELCDTATDEDKNFEVWDSKLRCHGVDVPAGTLINAGELIEVLRLKIIGNVEGQEHFKDENYWKVMKDHGSAKSPLLNDMSPSLGSLDAETIKEIFYPGGEFCDQCERTKSQAGVDKFLKCSRCNVAFYCSVECQKKAWKDWHSHFCKHRQPGKFLNGDPCRIIGLKNEDKRSLNGQCVTVCGEAETAGKWTCKIGCFLPGMDPDVSDEEFQNLFDMAPDIELKTEILSLLITRMHWNSPLRDSPCRAAAAAA